MSKWGLIFNFTAFGLNAVCCSWRTHEQNYGYAQPRNIYINIKNIKAKWLSLGEAISKDRIFTRAMHRFCCKSETQKERKKK